MPTPPTQSPRRSERERTDTHLRRRRLLGAGTAATIAAVAGCLSDDDPSDDEGNETDEPDGADGDPDGDGDADEGNEADDETELFEAIDAYLEAAADSDTDALADVIHSASPLHPEAWEEDSWEFQGGTEDGEDVDPFEGEVVTADGTVEDILEFESASFWFEEEQLREEIGDEDIALVEADDDWLAANGDPASEADLESATWVLVTEDDEWRVFFIGAEEAEPPANPEEAFEEEIIDEDDDVVEEIDWEYDSPTSDVPQAAVVLTDSRGIDAERVRVESTIAGGRNEAYDDEEFGATWTGLTLYVQFDPDGDQIVVTAVQDDEETVVHREHYRPDAESESESESESGGDTDTDA